MHVPEIFLGPLKYFENITMTSIYNSTYKIIVISTPMFNTNYVILPMYDDSKIRSLSLLYNYSDKNVRTIQVRLYSF